MVKEIDAAMFKDQCLPLLDRLDADGLIITKNGKPVAKITPYETGTRPDRQPAPQDHDQGLRVFNRAPLGPGRSILTCRYTSS